MARTSIDTTRLKQFREALKKSPEKLRESLQRTGVECAKILAHHIKRKAPKFQGELSNSIDGRSQLLGHNAEAAVVSSVPYAQVQDVGRRPGKMPPEEPIRRWVELKLFKRGGMMKKILESQGRKRARKGERERTVASLTFLIRRKIGREGTKATNYVTSGLRAATPALTKKMDALAAEVRRLLDE